LKNIQWVHWAAPQTFDPLAGKLWRPFAALAAVLALAGLYLGFFVAPTDFQQGEGYRIIFVHVPASWMSMVTYLAMAFWAGVGLVFNSRLSSMMALAIAPTGALMTFLALWTGALWGKPTWGTWWVWDARLTSELVLLFLYLGFMALQAANDDPRRADRAGAILALVGEVNIPVIYVSVQWCNTLHQGATVSATRAPSMASSRVMGMLLMVAAAWGFSQWVAKESFDPVQIQGLTFSGPSAEWLMRVVQWPWPPIGFEFGLMPGVFLGSLIGALLGKDWRLEGFTDGYSMRRYMGGAILMGFGSMLAGGCAVGAGVTGGAIFALTAWGSLVGMWAGAGPTARRLGGRPPANAQPPPSRPPQRKAPASHTRGGAGPRGGALSGCAW